MKLLAFSDLHRDLEQAKLLVEMAGNVDVVIGAGDFASVHEGLQESLDALKEIEAPIVLVPGNNETDTALRSACEGFTNVTVLHGDGAEIDGIPFFGLGGGIPTTPWDWSFDLTEDEAESKLSDCPQGCVLVTHSPPQGHVDGMAENHFGSAAILAAVEVKQPMVTLCGHIHECWGQQSSVNSTEIYNLGPSGKVLEV